MLINKELCSAVFLSLFLFVGCAASKDIGTSARLHEAPSINFETEKGIWPDEKWWESFQDPQLNTLVEEALAGSPTLSEAQARVREAEAAAGIARSSRSVQADISADSTFRRFTENGSVSPEFGGTTDTVNNLRLNLGYEFDLWGKNKADYQAALGMVKVAEIDSEAARLTLTAEIVQTYIQLDLSFKREEIAKELLRLGERILNLNEKRLRAGLDSAEGSKYAHSTVSARLSDIDEIRETQKLLKNRLGTLTGKGAARGSSIIAPALRFDKGIALPSELPAELIGRRPDIVAQKWKIESMERRVDSARADFYPNINLNAFAGFESIGLDNFLKKGSGVFGVGPAVTLPLFNGGRLKSSLAARSAEYDTEVERYNSLILNAVNEIADSVASWQITENRLAERSLILQKLNEIKALAEKRYDSGLSGIIPVLEAESGILSEKLIQENLKAKQAYTELALITALGGGLTPILPSSENK